jgi:hypothetical protein
MNAVRTRGTPERFEAMDWGGTVGKTLVWVLADEDSHECSGAR